MAGSGWGRALSQTLALLVAGALCGCTMLDLDFGQTPRGRSFGPTASAAPQVPSQSFGSGPVRVALLLPLSGGLADVGISMANGAKLAMAFIETNPNIAENTTIVLIDVGDAPDAAATQASAAIADGASVIIGPLRADQVSAAGAVARSAGVPLIGFSNDSRVAQSGVYLLNVLPEVEIRRSLFYAKGQGRTSFAAILPESDYGRLQQAAFQQVAAEIGLSVRAVTTFGDAREMAEAVGQLAPLLDSGTVDAVFMPDRANAPAIAALMRREAVSAGRFTIVGSVDWARDAAIGQTAFLSGALFPAVDEAGYNAILPDYQQHFGVQPHRFATLAYTAVILANASTLSMGTPRYEASRLTLEGGFNGRDGVFRFHPNGRSDFALVMRQVVSDGSVVVDGPKL